MRISTLISAKRKPVESPKNLVEDGKPLYGTFCDPIVNINLMDTSKPCGKFMPNFMKKMRYTAWEAFEISTDEISIVSAIYCMGAINFTICTLYDKVNKKVSYWQTFMNKKHISIAPNLINGSISEGKKTGGELKIINNFQLGKCYAKCKMINKKFGEISYEMSAEDLSPPSIVNIPLSKSHPLYTEKNIFTVKGHVIFNGKRYDTNENSLAIVDDHKGFYPFKASYDWLTTMSIIPHQGNNIQLGLNLTRNQSINHNDYNENVLWLKDESHALPPVAFKKIAKDTWTVKDEHDKVNLTYQYNDSFRMLVHLGIIDITYYLAFTTINGYVKDSEDIVYQLDNIDGIAEYRRQRI